MTPPTPPACPFELPGQPPCHGCRVDAAKVALRKARATLACETTPGFNEGCPTMEDYDLPYDGEDMAKAHRSLASAALDGFTVQEISAAERELER